MKLFKISALFGLLFVGAGLIWSCEDKMTIYDGPDYVRFTDSVTTYKESWVVPIEIKVHVVGKPQPQPLNISYIIGGSAREGKDYTIVGTRGTVTIPANSYFGSIYIQLINNSNNVIRSQDIQLTLSSAVLGESGQLLQVGGEKYQEIGKSYRLTINDDCLFGGVYNAQLQGYTNSATNIDFTSVNCQTYTVSNWNVGIFNMSSTKPKLSFVDNGDNTITVPTQYNNAFGDSIRGSGSWDPKTRAISITLQLKEGKVYETLPAIIYTPKTK